MSKPILLSVIEMGGYPNFKPLYERAGSDFRDRTSSLESMMSVVERLPDSRVIVFYEKEYSHQFERLLAVQRFHKTFAFPVPEQELVQCVQELA
jgi:hypothetical protein